MEIYIKSNREKTQDPKTGKFWCARCDGYLVSNLDKKCLSCGCIYNKRNSGRRVKYKKFYKGM